MKEIESNKHAWGQISEGHYRHFKKSLLEGNHKLNKYIQNELGDLSGKKVIHLQCNTGADSILATFNNLFTNVFFEPIKLSFKYMAIYTVKWNFNNWLYLFFAINIFFAKKSCL